MDKFKKDDKVFKVGTKTPIMIIVGKTVRGGMPYDITEDIWTCEFDKIGPHREEFKESELELFSDTEQV